MPTLIMESSPKFITCPDCGERYDNARKRRLIDTCGHPRCYSCLFVDKPCPLCQKLPKQRTSTAFNSNAGSNGENEENVHRRETNLKKDMSYVGSHPDLSELHKVRSATLPHSFTQDSYFKSLNRYEPNGSSENLSVRSSSPTNQGGRPRSMPPSYHVSIENLNEQFWKSVELAEQKIGPKRKGKGTQPNDPKEKIASSAEVVECPASSDVVRLAVPSATHPRAQLEHHLSRMDKKEQRRPRSFSDLNKPLNNKTVVSDSTNNGLRPLSWSPTQFPVVINGQGSPRPSSVASRDSTSSPLSPFVSRSTPKSDRFSDSSASIYLSDTWSESSDSDSIQSPTDEKSIVVNGDDSNPGQSRRRYTGNPLANVTYWVVEGRNSVEVHKSYRETESDRASSFRRQSAKAAHANQWNGQTNRSPNVPIVSVHTDVSTQ